MTERDSTAVDVDFSFKMNITTNVSVLIGVEFPDLDKHFFLTLDASSRLSPWIDMDEIKFDEKPIGEGGFGIVFKVPKQCLTLDFTIKYLMKFP